MIINSKIRFFMCLGNDGLKYNDTPHNLGFMFADCVISNLGAQNALSAKEQYLYKINDQLYISKPKTYMNLSGNAISELRKIVNCTPNQLLENLTVVHDDVETNMYQIKIKDGKQNPGLRGHNGLRSIVDAFQHMGIDNQKSRSFERIMLGCNSINRMKMDLSEYVLRKMNNEQVLEWDKIMTKFINLHLKTS